jgi:hypothetical protein
MGELRDVSSPDAWRRRVFPRREVGPQTWALLGMSPRPVERRARLHGKIIFDEQIGNLYRTRGLIGEYLCASLVLGLGLDADCARALSVWAAGWLSEKFLLVCIRTR